MPSFSNLQKLPQADSISWAILRIIEIYITSEWKEGLWAHNAKAHLNLSKPGELLINYNTITEDFWNDIQKNAHIYRPRFIKLKYTL